MKTNYSLEILAITGSDGYEFIPHCPENIFNFIKNGEGEVVINTAQEVSFCIVKDGSSNFPIIKGTLCIEGKIDKESGSPDLKFKTEIKDNPSRSEIINAFRNIIDIEYEFNTKIMIKHSMMHGKSVS